MRFDQSRINQLRLPYYLAKKKNNLISKASSARARRFNKVSSTRPWAGAEGEGVGPPGLFF